MHWLALFTAVLCGLSGTLYADTPFDYSSNIGIAVRHSGRVCLSIENPTLSVHTRVLLISASEPQSSAEAQVVRRARVSCRSAFRGAGEASRYELSLLKGSLPSGVPAVAIVGPVRKVDDRRGEVAVDLSGNGEKHVRSCTSSEGVHLTLWSGRPLVSTREWHGYYYLGYDVEPTCTAADTAE